MAELTKRARRREAPPLITAEDLAILLKLPVLAGAALLAPQSRWNEIAYRVEQMTRWLSRERLGRIRRGLQLGRRLAPADPLEVLACQTEQSIGVLREYLVGWSPKTELAGTCHLDAARAQGRGAVLWVAHFCFNSLAGKMALSRAGYRTWHVSRPEHGFTKSRFGMRVLNPIRIAAELGHLEGRLVIDRSRPASVMIEARHLLNQNGLVSITAGAWEGQLIVTAGLGDGEIELATGAPRLALLAGAPLIPVFVTRNESTGVFSVTVEEPLALDGAAGRNAAIAGATEQFLRRHAAYLSAFPGQWRDWEKIRAPSRRPPQASASESGLPQGSDRDRPAAAQEDDCKHSLLDSPG